MMPKTSPQCFLKKKKPCGDQNQNDTLKINQEHPGLKIIRRTSSFYFQKYDMGKNK